MRSSLTGEVLPDGIFAVEYLRGVPISPLPAAEPPVPQTAEAEEETSLIQLGLAAYDQQPAAKLPIVPLETCTCALIANGSAAAREATPDHNLGRGHSDSGAVRPDSTYVRIWADPSKDPALRIIAAPALVPIPEVFFPDPTPLQLVGVEDLHILPPDFRDEHVFAAPTNRFLWGRADRTFFGKFTVFDTHRHATIGQGTASTDLQTLIAQAVASAPFPVSAVHILTAPLSNLPKPQLVLHEAGRPLHCIPVPWDLRRTHGVIRTIEHKGGQSLPAALEATQATLVSEPTLLQRHERHEIAIADALGPILACLPPSLLMSQFFDVDYLPSGPLVTQRIVGPILAGSSLLQEGTTRTTTWTPSDSTTSTTTLMQAVTVAQATPILRLIVFRGGIAASADLNPPFRLLDQIMAQLITQISAMQPLSDNSLFVMSPVLPPPVGYVQEVIFVVSDSRANVPIVWDARPIGGGLQLLNQHPGTTTDGTLGATWLEEGWSLAVNGVPSRHIRRELMIGDFLQPFHGDNPYPAVPPGSLFAQCPQLAAYAWPLRIREGGLPMTTFSTLFPRLTEVLRRRRADTGACFREAGRAVVYGPAHGSVRLHFPNPTAPTIHDVADQMNRLDNPPPWRNVVKAAVLWPETGIFTTSSSGIAGQTVLLPVPFFPEQHFVMLVPRNPGLLEGLPGETNAQLMPRRSLVSGDVLYLQRDPGRVPEPESDIEEEAAVLLQLSALRAAPYPKQVAAAGWRVHRSL